MRSTGRTLDLTPSDLRLHVPIPRNQSADHHGTWNYSRGAQVLNVLIPNRNDRKCIILQHLFDCDTALGQRTSREPSALIRVLDSSFSGTSLAPRLPAETLVIGACATLPFTAFTNVSPTSPSHSSPSSLNRPRTTISLLRASSQAWKKTRLVRRAMTC